MQAVLSVVSRDAGGVRLVRAKQLHASADSRSADTCTADASTHTSTDDTRFDAHATAAPWMFRRQIWRF